MVQKYFSARNIFFFRKKYFSPQEIYFSPQETYFFPQEINFSPQQNIFFPQEIFFSARNIFLRKKYFSPQEIYFSSQVIYFFSARNIFSESVVPHAQSLSQSLARASCWGGVNDSSTEQLIAFLMFTVVVFTKKSGLVLYILTRKMSLHPPRRRQPYQTLLCFVVVIHWLIFPYPSGLLHWHVPAKQPWWIWINTSCEFIMNDCITTTEQSTTKPCAYFLGYTVSSIDQHICYMEPSY